MSLWWHKLTNWEFWPSQIINLPLYFLFVAKAIRARNLFFFNACNPTIKNGGMFAESKKEIYELMPDGFYPKTLLVRKNTNWSDLTEAFHKADFVFPLIAKPDIGLRGSAVKKLKSFDDLQNYLKHADFDFLLQDLIPFENEVGIFYVRKPNQATGRITGIVKKEFVAVVGNGKDTIEQLVKQNPRYWLQMKKIKKEFGSRIDQVLPDGQKLTLVPFGNHIRGAKFIDHSEHISEKLTATIDGLCRQIPGFFFGRLDLMFLNWEDLEDGKNFSIVELNGAGSEPTHIYDPKHSIFFAWKELIKHFLLMCEISVLNHQLGHPYLTFKDGVEQWKIYRSQNIKIKDF